MTFLQAPSSVGGSQLQPVYILTIWDPTDLEAVGRGEQTIEQTLPLFEAMFREGANHYDRIGVPLAHRDRQFTQVYCSLVRNNPDAGDFEFISGRTINTSLLTPTIQAAFQNQMAMFEHNPSGSVAWESIFFPNGRDVQAI